MLRNSFSILIAILLLAALPAQAADRVERMDKNKDGKTDTWHYYRDNALYKKEYDRNFDGRADFGVIVEGKQLLGKKYDDNFDGKFEKEIPAPEKGDTGRIRTTAPA